LSVSRNKRVETAAVPLDAPALKSSDVQHFAIQLHSRLFCRITPNHSKDRTDFIQNDVQYRYLEVASYAEAVKEQTVDSTWVVPPDAEITVQLRQLIMEILAKTLESVRVHEGKHKHTALSINVHKHNRSHLSSLTAERGSVTVAGRLWTSRIPQNTFAG
ncbi:hypothetical protein IRJ41_024113, partial [Triplophysa rosa]